jgi:hypothetical protein
MYPMSELVIVHIVLDDWLSHMWTRMWLTKPGVRNPD